MEQLYIISKMDLEKKPNISDSYILTDIFFLIKKPIPKNLFYQQKDIELKYSDFKFEFPLTGYDVGYWEGLNLSEMKMNELNDITLIGKRWYAMTQINGLLTQKLDRDTKICMLLTLMNYFIIYEGGKAKGIRAVGFLDERYSVTVCSLSYKFLYVIKKFVKNYGKEKDVMVKKFIREIKRISIEMTASLKTIKKWGCDSMIPIDFGFLGPAFLGREVDETAEYWRKKLK